MALQTEIIDEYGRPSVLFHETEAPSFEGRPAIALVEKWGMVAAMPDGEDAAGRAKLRLATPDDMASRSCDSAARLANEMRARGWLIAIPTLDEMEAEIKRQQEAKKGTRPRG